MKKGFTLIELMVVIAILATLMGFMMASLGGANETAERAKVQTLVTDTATALDKILLNNGVWPKNIIDNNNKQLTEKVATAFARNNLLGLSFKTSNDTITLQGNDRCGIVDHWAEATLKKSDTKSGGSDRSKKAGKGSEGTVEDHTLWYAVDEDGDGITEISAEGIGSLKVRATACVWAAGRDGKVAPWSKHTKADDVYSWSEKQVVK